MDKDSGLYMTPLKTSQTKTFQKETKSKQLNCGFPAKAILCSPLGHFMWVIISLHPKNVTEHSQTQDGNCIRQAGAIICRHTVMPYTQEAPAHLYWMLTSTQPPTCTSGQFGTRTSHGQGFFPSSSHASGWKQSGMHQDAYKQPTSI